jgi:hypothetical protein
MVREIIMNLLSQGIVTRVQNNGDTVAVWIGERETVYLKATRFAVIQQTEGDVIGRYVLYDSREGILVFPDMTANHPIRGIRDLRPTRKGGSCL